MSGVEREKVLVLGSALWGWGVDRQTAFSLLDAFNDHGAGMVDCATNYPINKIPKDSGIALKWISEWSQSRAGHRLKVIVKVGSTSNLGDAESNLSPPEIANSCDKLRNQFLDTLGGISVHWDNRASDLEMDGIRASVHAVVRLLDDGLYIGFSGVLRPDVYLAAAPAIAHKWLIQVKETSLDQTARTKYEAFFPQANYLAYGINFGGLKDQGGEPSSSLSLRGRGDDNNLRHQLNTRLAELKDSDNAPKNFNELALHDAFCREGLRGVVMGPRNASQLQNTLEYWNALSRVASHGTLLADVKEES